MNIPRAYIDISVIGSYFDEEFSKWSNGLMKDFRLGHFKLVISDVVDVEIQRAPKYVQDKYLQLLDYGAEFIEIDEEALILVGNYIKAGILNSKFLNDMRHIALATVNEVDLLLSWNFKHIVHFDKIRQFNIINKRFGYKQIQIYSPREVANYEEDRCG